METISSDLEKFWDEKMSTGLLNGFEFEEYHDKYVAPYSDIKSRIVEIGCGTGLNLPYLNNHFETVSACDISQESINISISKFPNNNIKKSEYGKKLPFSSASFDVVFLIKTLSAIPDVGQQGKILKEITRILDKHGKLVLVDFCFDQTNQYRNFLKNGISYYNLQKHQCDLPFLHIQTKDLGKLLKMFNLLKYEPIKLRSMNNRIKEGVISIFEKAV